MKVRPISFEVGRYFVESTTTGGEHLCDVLEDTCGCADWTCKHRKHTAATSTPYRCKHLKAAREYALNDYIEVMRECALRR
jgi:hypothetical protein